MKPLGRRKVQARPDASMCFSTARCQRPKTNSSAAARSAESLTTRRTPARRAASTNFFSGATVLEMRKTVSTPSRAGRIVSGRS